MAKATTTNTGIAGEKPDSSELRDDELHEVTGGLVNHSTVPTSTGSISSTRPTTEPTNPVCVSGIV